MWKGELLIITLSSYWSETWVTVHSNIKNSLGYTKEYHYAHSNKTRKLLEGATKNKRLLRQIPKMDNIISLLISNLKSLLDFATETEFLGVLNYSGIST